MSTIKRIKSVIEYKKMSIRAFERFIEVSINVIQAALKKNTGVKDDTLAKILEACPDVNPVWLITGKGAMLLESDKELKDNTLKALEEAKTQYATHIDALKKFIDAKDEIIALQKEKIQLLEGSKEERLALISVQNQKIMDYFEALDIATAIKHIKQKLNNDVNKKKQDC